MQIFPVLSAFYDLLRLPVFKYMMVLYTMTFIVILPVCLHKTRFSLYYTKPNLPASIKSMKLINSARVHEAEMYLNSSTLKNENLNKNRNVLMNNTERINYSAVNKVQANSNSITTLNHNIELHANSEKLDLVISVIAMNRQRSYKNRETEYLTQTVGKFLSLLNKTKTEKFPYMVKLFICNVDIDSATFTEVQFLKKYVPVVSRFETKHRSVVHVLEKEKQDYIFCLNSSLNLKPRYTLLVEDDALPMENFFPVLKQTMEMHLDNIYYHGEFYPQNNETAYVKFYHPERLLGYLAFGQERLTELIGSSIICSSVVIVILYSIYNIPHSYIRILWFTLIVYFVLVFIAIGRANVNTWRNVFSPYLHTYSPAPSCCTPAVLFPSSNAKQVIEFLANKTCRNTYAKDSVLDELLKVKKLKAFIVQPSTFTHIGMYSSLHKNAVDPSNV